MFIFTSSSSLSIFIRFVCKGHRRGFFLQSVARAHMFTVWLRLCCYPNVRSDLMKLCRRSIILNTSQFNRKKYFSWFLAFFAQILSEMWETLPKITERACVLLRKVKMLEVFMQAAGTSADFAILACARFDTLAPLSLLTSIYSCYDRFFSLSFAGLLHSSLWLWPFKVVRKSLS